MGRAAVEGVDGIEASDLELARDGPTYTFDTVAALASPHRELFLVVGADVATGLDRWYRATDLRKAVTVGVVTRARDTSAPALDGWKHVDIPIPRIDISSSMLRDRIAAGSAVDFYMPPAVVRVIRERRLYTPPVESRGSGTDTRTTDD
jgi:nicotinate-nucleotide adenylyltransferase